MAVTTYKRQEEIAKQVQPVQSSTPYSGMAGVSENTARNLGNYQQGYKPSEAVTAAQQNLQQVQAQKPQSYTSKYAPQLESIMQQITNPQAFKYEFNGDNLFKAYADKYVQHGKQASADVMGQAAALTGGYGNSYAQQAGQQAYQQYLLDLYDKGLDLRDRAYQQHQDQQANNYNIYNTLAGAEAEDYGRYRDTLGDWQTEEQLAYNRAQDAEQNDYDRYVNDLKYWMNLAQSENAAYTNDRQLQEQIRQADLDEAYRRDMMAANQASADKEYAYNYAMSILANGQMPTDELLAALGLSREDAQRMMAQLADMGTGGGSGGSGGGSGGRSGKTNGYYVTKSGDYFKIVNGKLVPADESQIRDTDEIYTDFAELQNVLYGSGADTASTLSDYRNLLSSMNAGQALNNQLNTIRYNNIANGLSRSQSDQLNQMQAQINQLQANNTNGRYDAQIQELKNRIRQMTGNGNG